MPVGAWNRPRKSTPLSALVRMICGSALVLACGQAAEPTSSTTPATTSSTTRAQADERLPARQGEQASSATALPRAGKVELDIRDGRITLLANAAPRRPLLERLAWALEFELDAPDIGDEPITVEAIDVALPEVLPRLFPNRPYRVGYRFDAIERTHRIARLEVGHLGSTAIDGTEASIPAPPARHGRPAPGALERQERRFADEPLTPPEDTDPDAWQDILAQLDDPDWEERVGAVEGITPEAGGLTVLVDLLRNDPQSDVRAAAASQLEESETRAAVDALLLALYDEDREVVLAAIDALEFTDDESIADDIRPLENHADREVRETARDAVCFIADCD